MLKRVRVRFWHENCWLLDTSEDFPEVTTVITSAWALEDEVQVDFRAEAPDEATLSAVEDNWRDDPRIHQIERIYDGSGGNRYLATYDSGPSVYPHIVDHAPISIGTIRISGGSEYFSVITEASEVEDLLETLDRGGDVDLQAVESLDEDSGDERSSVAPPLADLLTDRQLEALVLAHMGGYYDWPRDLAACDLADDLGISPSTLHEHLRRAESRVLDTVVGEFKDEAPALYAAVREVPPDPPDGG